MGSGQVTIPRTAPPGYQYLIGARHHDGKLYLVAAFQVCTLKPSVSSITRGSAVTLSGVVPTQGHLGKQAGLRKPVFIYSRSKAAGPPTVPDATKRGWKLVKVLKTDGHGKFKTGLQRPQRDTWYVAAYTGDDWYWGGYTSVVKVDVR